MATTLVRTTTYFDPDLLIRLKKMAIDEDKRFYELINEKLEQAITAPPSGAPTTQKPFSYTQKYSTFALGLKKKKLRRSDAYE